MNKKDKAYEEGEGLQWNRNWDGSCRCLAYILHDIFPLTLTTAKPSHSRTSGKPIKDDRHDQSFAGVKNQD